MDEWQSQSAKNGYTVFTGAGCAPVKCWANNIEASGLTTNIDRMTMDQALNAAKLPFLYKWLALMPDAHGGYGVPVGSVLATEGYVIPNAVGVDIGCGMCAFNTGLKRSEVDVSKVMDFWMEYIPVGRSMHDPSIWIGDSDREKAVKKLLSDVDTAQPDFIKDEMGRGDYANGARRFVYQLGTLGGGNHFVELQVDENDIVWVMLHSGSRGFGAAVANHFHEKAKRICQDYLSDIPTLDLAFFPMDSEGGKAYWEMMNIAQDYAMENRFAMMRAAIAGFGDVEVWDFSKIINIHHNYAAIENHYGKNVVVHRKGATCVRKGTIGIIPGSMTTHSYIVEGKGCEDSFHSCSHGAGRPFSRTESKRRVDDGRDPSQGSQLDKAGVAVYGSDDVRDELGSSYKDINVVMDNQKDLVDIVTKLAPIAVLKG